VKRELLYKKHGASMCAVLAACTGGADKSLARLGRKQATATEDFEFHITYL
jgi:hypothetical protein